MQLCDEGPRRLMEKMIQKAGSDFSTRVIADLFRSKLPKKIARMLVQLDIDKEASDTDSLKKLADSAEKLYRFEQESASPKASVAAVSTYQPNVNMESDTSNLNKRISDLENKVNHLTKVIDKLLDSKSDKNNSGNNSNAKNQNKTPQRRSRSKSVTRIDYSLPENKGKCSDVSCLPANKEERKKEPIRLLYAANGTPIKVFGEKLIEFKIGFNHELKWVMLITDVETPII
ncbi:unnamed protein product, partial [Brugia timori]|uniref:Reverse transcriptase domain-containing protein n=1 Tax=Brugia timori TaxID=42155 RepID=A0A0R3QJ17_9BILA